MTRRPTWPKTRHEIDTMRAAGQRLTAVLDALAPLIVPDADLETIDAEAERRIRAGGDTPSFKGYHGYPASLCASVNDEVVHGIPRHGRILREGDIVGIAIGLIHDGLHADMARTFAVGAIDDAAARLVAVTAEALAAGIAAAVPGAHVGVIGATVQRYVENAGYGIVRDLVGHGIGHSLHEDPMVPNFGDATGGPLLVPGMTLAIEPMVTEGDWHVQEDDDGWTIRTRDASRSAHWEHTVLITDRGNEILTQRS